MRSSPPPLPQPLPLATAWDASALSAPLGVGMAAAMGATPRAPNDDLGEQCLACVG